MTALQKLKYDLVVGVAMSQINAQGDTTTLDIKNELIVSQPDIVWKQSDVSEIMAEAAQRGSFSYVDNGEFREYSTTGIGIMQVVGMAAIQAATPAQMPTPVSMPVPPSVPVKKPRKPVVPMAALPVTKLALTKIVDEVKKKHGGHFLTVCFKKKTTGQDREMNGQYIGTDATLGHLKFKTAKGLRTVDPHTIYKVRMKGQVLQVK